MEGRFKGTKALAFEKEWDRLQMDFGKASSGMTLFLTVRIDQLKNATNILAMSNGFEEVANKISWHLDREGNLYFSISGNEGNIKTDKGNIGYETFVAPGCFTRKDRGTWMKLAVVIDAEAGTVSQYKDGRLLARSDWKNTVMIQPGTLNIGNADPAQKGRRARYLSVAIEEILLYARALTPEEIK